MQLLFAVLVLATFVEMLLWLKGLWRWHRPIAVVAITALAVAALGMVAVHAVFATVFLLVLAAYRTVNLLRLIKNRTQAVYLQRTFTRTSSLLVVFTVITLAAWYVCYIYDYSSSSFWTGFGIAQLLGIMVIVASTERHLRTTCAPADVNGLASTDLPTLTVAIPARNETDDLHDCLESLVASDYPKLEIIVLDDCSQTRRTPEIIRGFAQDGVRFLQGKAAEEGWLAKNQAYQMLLDASNGEYVLFAGVDTRFEPQTLRRLVEAMLHKKKTMMSIIPSNHVLTIAAQSESILLQPARYAWELSLPRKMFNRPPVLSTCWIISKKLLSSAGGFSAVSRSIVPESYFARVSSVHDGYSFMQSNESIGLRSYKVAPEQWATAIRTRYPQLHRRPELVFLMTVAELVGFVLPFGFLVAYAIADVTSPGFFLALASCILILYFYGRVVSLTYRTFLFRGFLLAPFAALVDMAVLNSSMIKYEFSEVVWKGRNVCIPVMRVEPRLPDASK
jgi:hypothetical protein